MTGSDTTARSVYIWVSEGSWRASVDGLPVPLWRANYAFQALEVPSGRHEVRIAYVDRIFQTGAIISIVALIFCATMIWKGVRHAPISSPN